MSKAAWFTAAILWTLTTLLSQRAIAQEPAETPQQKVERALDEDATLEFVKSPLQDVLNYLAKQHAVKIELAPETKEDPKSVDLERLVTRNIKRISLRSVLHLLLDERGLEVTVTPQGELLLVKSTPELRAKRVESEVQKSRRAKLTRKLKSEPAPMEFFDCPLKDVIAFLSDQCDCTIVFDRRGTTAGTLPNEPVSLSRSELPLGESLKRVLLPFDIQATIQDEVILIVPRDPLAKSIPSADVAKTLDSKFDLNLTATLPGLAMQLTEVTGTPFLLHIPALKAADVDMKKSFVAKHQRATPLQIIQATPTAVPLKLIERDGVVLITAEPRK